MAIWFVHGRSAQVVDFLLPHNQTRCVLEGHNASACAVFSAFNFSTCLNTHFRYPALPRLPTAAASCLLASGCLPLYDVQPCVGAGGFNLTALQFNRSTCEHLFSAANVTLPPNATGCAGMNATDAAVDDDDGGKDDGDDKDDADDDGGEEGLPRFSACIGAYDQEKLRRLSMVERAPPRLGSALARLLRFLWARLAALGGMSHLGERAGRLGAPPPHRELERAASKFADYRCVLATQAARLPERLPVVRALHGDRRQPQRRAGERRHRCDGLWLRLP